MGSRAFGKNIAAVLSKITREPSDCLLPKRNRGGEKKKKKLEGDLPRLPRMGTSSKRMTALRIRIAPGELERCLAFRSEGELRSCGNRKDIMNFKGKDSKRLMPGGGPADPEEGEEKRRQ